MTSTKELVRLALPRTRKPRFILAGPLRGSRLVTSWHDYPGALLGRTERRLLTWFDEHVDPGQTWLDVGAHYGYTALALCRLVGDTGRVFAFEPMIATAGCLEQTRQLNALSQLVVIPLALGEGSARVPVGVRRGMAEVGSKSPTRHDYALSVALDEVWSWISPDDRRVDGVKIDVQGMEGDTLRGMRAMLTEQHPKIVLEFHAGVDRAPILAFLERCGYQLPGLAVETNEAKPGGTYDDDASYSFGPEAHWPVVC